MLPSAVPVELKNLKQIEEMLIARVVPVMSVYTKPGGQRAYRGHCINFPEEVQQLFYTLPRQPKELPVIIVTVDGKNDMSKDLIVRRENVSYVLHWLVSHNPAYRDVQIDYDCLAQLPLEGIPADLSKVRCKKGSGSEELDPDKGPLDTELSSMLNPVKSKQQKEIIRDEILQHNKIGWPERGQIPVSEFKVQFLATMAFPTLFPDSKGEKINHLVKFGEKKKMRNGIIG